MLDFRKLAKRKKSGPKNQSPSIPEPQIDKPLKPQSESVQPLSAPKPAIVSQETSPHPDFLDASQEMKPLLAEAKKRYNESAVSLDQVLHLYAAKSLVAKCNAKDFEAIVQMVLDGADTEVPTSALAQVKKVLSKLMPLIKLALGLTQSGADVFPLF
jgi:hypothetical protein